MTQNRNKLIDLFVGNLTNAILHKILEKAIFENPEISSKYQKEVINSWEAAKIYREKINPKNSVFPQRDIEKIRKELVRRVCSEINSRISAGYKNLTLESVEEEVDKALIEMKIELL
jgi:hypothetical protein